MKGFVKIGLCLVLSLFFWASPFVGVLPSHAHRFYAAFTQMDINDGKKTIEITHRLATHDVEDYLNKKGDNVSDSTREASLKDLVEGNFALFHKDGRELPLLWVGMTYATDAVLIYQEAMIPDNPPENTAHSLDQCVVMDRLFMDLLSEQKNTVNVEWNHKIRTRIFIKGNERQTVDFTVPD